jgi:hypothetical protein
MYLAASAALLGNEGQARNAVDKLLEQMPKLTADHMRNRTMLRQTDDVNHLIKGLVAAGVPKS